MTLSSPRSIQGAISLAASCDAPEQEQALRDAFGLDPVCVRDDEVEYENPNVALLLTAAWDLLLQSPEAPQGLSFYRGILLASRGERLTRTYVYYGPPK